jgi:hypothetical protein
MFIWDIAPWMRQTTVQLNAMTEMLEAMEANQALIVDMLSHMQPKDMSPEQQKMLNEIYERAVTTRAKMEAVKRT